MKRALLKKLEDLERTSKTDYCYFVWLINGEEVRERVPLCYALGKAYLAEIETDKEILRVEGHPWNEAINDLLHPGRDRNIEDLEEFIEC